MTELTSTEQTNSELVKNALQYFKKENPKPFPTANEEVVYFRSDSGTRTWSQYCDGLARNDARSLQGHLAELHENNDVTPPRPALAIFLTRRLPDGRMEYFFRGR
jgi:hypothetical protein